MSRSARSSDSGTPGLVFTPRQREVLDLLVRGRTNAQIAEALGISLDGAKWHVNELIGRLGLGSREEVAEYWRARNGLKPRFTRFAHLASLGLPRPLTLAVAMAVAIPAAVLLVAVLRDEGTAADGPDEVAAASAVPPEVDTTTWMALDDRDMTLEYPSAWHIDRYEFVSSFTDLRFLLGNVETHDPCTQTADGTTHCGAAVDRLDSGQVLVSVTHEGFPGWDVAKVHGAALTVGGRPGKLLASTGCSLTAAGRQLEAVVAGPAPSNFHRFTACFSGPSDLQLNEARFRHMLETVRFKE